MWVVNPASSRPYSASVASALFSSRSISIVVSLKKHTSCWYGERKMWDVQARLFCSLSDSHINHSFFSFAWRGGGVITLASKWQLRPQMLMANTSCASRQQQGDLDWFYSKRAWIKHVLICISKGKNWQSKTKPNKDVGAEKGGESFFLNLLWIPNIPRAN